MTEEVGRRLINGVWVTNVEAQGGSGGDGITRVTSDDDTVTITNPTGPTVDLSAGGGSGPVKFAEVTVSSAELLAIDTDAVTLVAGVPGKVLNPISGYVIFLPDTTPYNPADMNIVWFSRPTAPFDNAGWATVGAGGLIDQTTSIYGQIIGTSGQPYASLEGGYYEVEGAPIALEAGTAPTDGDGSLVVGIYYTEITAP